MGHAAKSAVGQIVSTDPAYTFTVTGNRTLTAVFEEAPVYTIAASVDPEGSGTVTGAGQYQEGATVTLKAVPGDGFEFGGWQENGQTMSENSTYTFTAQSDRDLVAVFAEKPTSRLPAGYTEVEYIELSGCSFATGVYVTQHIRTVVDVSPLDSPTTETAYFVQAYLSAASTSNRIYYDTTWHTSGIRCRVGKGSVSHKVVSSNATPRRILLTMDYYNQIVSANDESVSTVNNLWITSGSGPKINLLGTSTAASTLHARLYSCQIFDDGSLIRDFAPCINPSNEIGLYDLAFGAFYSKTGGGTITSGPAI